MLNHRSHPQRPARGQALLLGALTLLVVSLMVIMTLEIGMRTKRRMEAQVLADAAAYNQAVLAARTYNQIALMNRGAVATWVSLAATQSLISWSGAAYNYATEVAANNGAPDNLKETGKTACKLDTSGYNSKWGDAFEAAGGYKSQFTAADEAAGFHAIDDQGSAVALRDAAKTANERLASAAFSSLQTTKNVIAKAFPGGSGAKFPFTAGAGTELVVTPNSPNESRVMLFAVMGSRGNSFVSNRGPVPVPTTLFPPGGDFTLTETSTNAGGGGGAGFGPPGSGMSVGSAKTYSSMAASHRAQSPLTANGLVSWADDDAANYDWEMDFTCLKDGKVAKISFQNAAHGVAHAGTDAYVGSTDQHDDNDKHWYLGENDTFHTKPPETEHTLFCTDPVGGPECHGVFGGGYAFDEGNVASADRVFAQPMGTTVVTLDPSAVHNPWDLSFKYRAGADVEKFTTKPAGLGKLVAVSTGIAYYHRQGAGHEREAPNFYNPYWRATIMSGVLNKKGVASAMGSNGTADQQSAVNILLTHGYRGF